MKTTLIARLSTELARRIIELTRRHPCADL